VKLRYLVAAGAAAALALTACGSSSSGGGSGSSQAASGTLTVWLQTDAQQGWPEAVQAASTAFNAKHPNVKVDVQYQSWGDHLTKLDATLAGSTPPDVVELGNTEMTKYMAAGALADLSGKKSEFENSSTWLKSLADSATFDGKTYGVPYYAGSRAVIYRKDAFTKAGIAAPPTSMDEFKADNDKLMKAYAADSKYSAFYFPGKYWYAAMSFVYDFGGQIATEDGGQWKGTLDSTEAQQGLTELKGIVAAGSRADKTGDEAKQDQAFAAGHVAQIYGNGWEVGVILDPKQGNPALKPQLAAYPLPSHNAGQYAPAFLGGSDLAVTAKSKQHDLAAEWIADFTSNTNMTAIVNKAGVLPNTTSLLSLLDAKPDLAPFAKAASNSWFVPTAPNWANVEKAGTIPNMLTDIFTGKASVADATKQASDEITQILNQG
jgi:N,N'-diacetylchitobiose transport system substrate-binding protein